MILTRFECTVQLELKILLFKEITKNSNLNSYLCRDLQIKSLLFWIHNGNNLAWLSSFRTKLLRISFRNRFNEKEFRKCLKGEHITWTFNNIVQKEYESVRCKISLFWVVSPLFYWSKPKINSNQYHENHLVLFFVAVCVCVCDSGNWFDIYSKGKTHQ